MRDLEGALDVEKSANNEANKAIDRLTKQIRELEHSYDEERKNGKELGIKLERFVLIRNTFGCTIKCIRKILFYVIVIH